MCIARQRVFGQFYAGGLTPSRIGTCRLNDLCIARIRGVGHTLREVHLALVGRKAAGALVVGGVQASRHGLGFRPFTLVVLGRYKDVAILGARDAT